MFNSLFFRRMKQASAKILSNLLNVKRRNLKTLLLSQKAMHISSSVIWAWMLSIN